MAPYPIDTPLDFNTDPAAGAVADAPTCFHDTEPLPLDTGMLLAELGLSAHGVREVLSRTVAGGFGGLE